MKFKIKLIALVLIVVMAMVLVLTACDNDTGLIRKNQERVGKQITAEATYAGRTGIVTVNDVYTSYYNYYANIYMYYQYGYFDAATFKNYVGDPEKTFGLYNESLAKDAMFDLKCIDELYKYFKANCKDETKVAAMEKRSTAGKEYDFGDVTSLARFYKDRFEELKAIYSCYDNYYYVNKAIKYANDAMQKLYDQYVEEVEAEFDAAEGNTDEEDTTPSGYVGIELTQKPYRLVYEKGDENINTSGMIVKALYKDADAVVIPNEFLTISGFDASSVSESVEISVKYGKYTQTFDISVVDALPSKGEESEEEESDDEVIARLTNDNADILPYFSFTVLESSYVKEGQNSAQYKAAIREYKIANTAMNRVLKNLEDNYRSFNYYLYLGFNDQLEDITKEVLTGNSVVTLDAVKEKYDQKVAAEIEGYFTTPYSSDSITTDTIVHKNYAHELGNNEGYYYVTQILVKFDADTLEKALDFEEEKVANQDKIDEYLLSLLPEVTAYTFNPDYDADATCDLAECNCPRCANYNGKEYFAFDTIEKWYGVYEGDDFVDPCKNVHTGDSTCTCAACPAKKYVQKVNAMDYLNELSAALNECVTMQEKVEKFNEYVNMINMDSGIFTNIKEGKIGYLMTPKGIDSGMIKAFEDKSLELAENGVGSFGYTIGEYETDKYGIHFIMVTEYVTDEANGTITPITLKTENDYVKLGLDYFTNIYAGDKEVVATDAQGDVTFKEGSIGYTLWNEVNDESKSLKISEFRKDFLSSDAASGIETYPKAYKDTVKTIQKQFE